MLKISPVPSPSISPTPSAGREADDGVAALSPISEGDEEDDLGEKDMDISAEIDESAVADATKRTAEPGPLQKELQLDVYVRLPFTVAMTTT